MHFLNLLVGLKRQRDRPCIALSFTKIVSYLASSTESFSSLPTLEIAPSSDDYFELGLLGSPSSLSGELFDF